MTEAKNAGSVVYVVGHKNPDCDSVVSAIAYSEIKNVMASAGIGHSELARGESAPARAIPVRTGPVNRETSFVLQEFGFEPPVFLPNAYPQVMDVPFDRPLFIKHDATLLEVWSRMQEERSATGCVVDDDGRLAGVVTIGDIARAELNSSIDTYRYTFPLENLVWTLDAEVLVPGPTLFDGRVVVGDMSCEKMPDRIRKGDLMILGDRDSLQAETIRQGASVLVLTGGAVPSTQVTDLAQRFNTCVLGTTLGTFTCLRLLWQAVPVAHVATSDGLIVFSKDDLVQEVKEEMRARPFKFYPVADEHGRPVGMLGRNHLVDPARKQFILVDHNEKNQSIEGIDNARVLEVIDHHRISCIETDHPILFVNRPWGSTATIVSYIARQQQVVLRPELAGLMCAAIISDTLAFKSPTSTDQDRVEAEALAQVGGVNLDELAQKVLQAKCDIEDANPDEILRSDFKEFTVGKTKVGIGQATTYGRFADSLKEQLIAAMQHLMEDAGYSLVALMLTDVVSEGSEILWTARDAGLVERAFSVEAGTSAFYLAGVVSRKQQVVPEVMRAIREGERM